jgi:hypothetical protein
MGGPVSEHLRGLNGQHTMTSDRLRQLGALADQWLGNERGRKEVLETLKGFSIQLRQQLCDLQPQVLKSSIDSWPRRKCG